MTIGNPIKIPANIRIAGIRYLFNLYTLNIYTNIKIIYLLFYPSSIVFRKNIDKEIPVKMPPIWPKESDPLLCCIIPLDKAKNIISINKNIY